MDGGRWIEAIMAGWAPARQRVWHWLRFDLRTWPRRAAVAGIRLAWSGLRSLGGIVSTHPLKTIGILIPGVLSAFFLYEVLFARTIMFLPVAVPKGLQERGYTADVATTRLRDAVDKVIASANTSLPAAYDYINTTIATPKNPNFALHEDFPDLVVPTVGLSLETVAAYIRMFFHIERRRNISGEFTIEHDELRLRLRMDGKIIHESSGADVEMPDRLLERAATDVVHVIVPYVSAVNKSRTDPTEAVRMAKRIIANGLESDDNVVWAHNLIGTIFYRQYRLDDAMAEFDEAIRLNSRFAAAYNNRGLVWLRQYKKENEAIVQFRTAIQYQPDFAFAHYYLASALNDNNEAGDAVCEYQHALAEFHSAVISNARSAAYHDDLAYAIYPHGSAAVTECGYLPLIAKAWRYFSPPVALDQIDDARSVRDQLDKVRDEFQQAIEFNPHDAAAHNGLGQILVAETKNGSLDADRRNAKIDEAIAAFRRAVDADRHFADGYRSLGIWLDYRHKTDDGKSAFKNAMGEYQRLIDVESRDSASLKSLANILLIMGHTSDAIKALDKVIEKNPAYGEARIARGFAHFDAGNFANAAEDLAVGVPLQPSDKYAALWLYLARARLQGPEAELRAVEAKLKDEAAASNSKTKKWPQPVFELFSSPNGNPDATVDAAARAASYNFYAKCEAQFYTAEWYLLRHDIDKARQGFEIAEQTCPRNFIEYPAARAELARLGG
jgi:tetratricopeptide (TPR) repeat protein